MRAINPAVPIYLHAEPIDMRKSFDGLFGIVKVDLQRDVRNRGLAKQKEKIDTLHTSLQVALADIRFLRSGRKREKFINANQLLLEFPEDKELQASLESARKEAEEEVERFGAIPVFGGLSELECLLDCRVTEGDNAKEETPA